jgi:hypothetical protein
MARRVLTPSKGCDQWIKADVLTLALFSDADSLRKHGLIAEGWSKRPPTIPALHFDDRFRRSERKSQKDKGLAGSRWCGHFCRYTESKANYVYLRGFGHLPGGSETQIRDYLMRLCRNVSGLQSGAR